MFVLAQLFLCKLFSIHEESLVVKDAISWQHKGPLQLEVKVHFVMVLQD